MPPRTVLRVGMVGYGDVGRIHAMCWRSLAFYYPGDPWRVEIVGVATSREETARAAAEEIGCSYWSTSWEDLVTHPDVDLVDCVTPDHFHAPVSIAALEAGKHVYCEKPLTVSVERARAMADAARASGRTNAVALPVRFAPGVRRARELIEAGLLGRVVSFRSSLLHGSYIDPARPMSWRLDRSKTGGGALYDLGAHNIDLIRSLLGEIGLVTARLETVVPERPAGPGSSEMRRVEVDDHAVALAELHGGAVGTMEFSRVATGVTDGPSLEAHGTDGALRFNFVRPNLVQAFDRRRDEGFRDVVVPERWPRLGFVPLHRDVAEAALQGRQAAVTFDDGLRVQLVLEAIQRAGAERRWVRVSPAQTPSTSARMEPVPQREGPEGL